MNIKIMILWEATAEFYCLRTTRLQPHGKLKMDTDGSPETLAPIYQTTSHHIPEHYNLNFYHTVRTKWNSCQCVLSHHKVMKFVSNFNYTRL